MSRIVSRHRAVAISTRGGAAAMSQTIEITKVTPHCGAEIHGVDLSQPLDDATYEARSVPMKRLLEGMTAIHDGEHVYRGRYEGVVETGKTYPRSEHPVIRTHPVSGRKALFVNRGFTTRIVQLSRPESSAVL